MPKAGSISRKPPRTRKGQRTRRLILGAARRVLNRSGYRDARISDIIEETGWPTGTFYRYFDGKVDVTLQVLQELARDYSQRVPSAASSSLFERELAAHQRLIELFEVNPGVVNCYFSCGEKEEGLVRFFHDQTDRFIEAYFAFVEKHSDFATVSKKDFYPVASTLIGMSENLVYRLFLRRERAAQPAQHDVALMLSALRYRAITGADTTESIPPVLAALRGPRKRARPGPWSADVKGQARVRAEIEPGNGGPLGLRADSRATLKIMERATLGLLDCHGYEDLRLSDIEESSGVTRGAIYHHYADKDSLIRKVLLDRLTTMDASMSAMAVRCAGADLSAFDKLLLFSKEFVGRFAETPGVLRVLNQMENRDREVTASYDAKWKHWTSILSELLFRHAAGRVVTPADLRLIADAFLAMAERLLRDLYVAPFGKLKLVVKSRESAAVLLAALWYRMGFCAAPPELAAAHFPFFRLRRENEIHVVRPRNRRAPGRQGAH
jgi:AcrR family transcriptional regulator